MQSKHDSPESGGTSILKITEKDKVDKENVNSPDSRMETVSLVIQVFNAADRWRGSENSHWIWPKASHSWI